ncbi:sigma-54 interaction domain-containing protein [Methylobacterium sp. J-068]|uniref:sigma-54 interaction domain-containing protein n=1 Tax=Methylobacterium sp. J-068 TaxID=2836649 RepID=UPI001FBA1019|nr:sigma 54-interacting transcriptional regulator [Methylobacterium sp. J-068]MCJ2035333.1 sigma 54-interacting transcriptional regulator [Methylobacterium sp. J-068]
MPADDPRTILDALPLCIEISGDDGTVYANAEARRIGLGPTSSPEGRTPSGAHPSQRAASDGAPYRVVALALGDGRTLRLGIPPALFADAEPCPVEAQRLAEDFQEIFRNSFDGIFVADGAGRTLMVNAGCERNYDLSAREMIGRHVSEFEALGLIRPVIATQVITTAERVTAVQTTHKGKTIMVTGIPLFDEDGAVRRVVINSRDTTELTQLQAELARIQAHLARVEGEVAHLRRDRFKLDGIVLQSTAMRRVAEMATRVARVDATVLITGESGVGKEVLARLIHRESPRAKGPFIKINCGAIPRELLESELFGYEGGAFTGARSKGKPGLVELADGGTLFLDEVGELPLDMQVKLLHVLQDRTTTRVGGTQSVRIDARMVAATNRDLAQMVEARSFREDLFYRLNVVPIEIPPLRERRDDILPLTVQALAEINSRYRTARRLTPSALAKLIEHDWPGNVRELRNLIERLVVIAQDDTIGLDGLPQLPSRRCKDGNLLASVEAYERRLVAEAVERLGSTRAAAKSLGISQSSVVRKLKRPLLSR